MSVPTLRFATVHIQVEKEMPVAVSLPDHLTEWGLNTQTQEVLWVIAYDSIQQIRTVVEVARGNYHEMDVSLPVILTVPLLAGVDRFAIVHNHPSGDINPTVLDVDLTRKVLAAANTCGLYFEDHYIIGPGEAYYSFFERGLLGPAQLKSRKRAV